MSATSPQPGERQRPDWLLDEIRRGGPHDLRGLATPRNLLLLADEIAQLQQERAAAPDIAAARVNTLAHELAETRALLAEYGGWVYFRVEDPANPIRPRTSGQVARRGRTSRSLTTLPPGKYVQMCRVCGALRSDGHRPECVIGRALAP